MRPRLGIAGDEEINVGLSFRKYAQDRSNKSTSEHAARIHKKRLPYTQCLPVQKRMKMPLILSRIQRIEVLHDHSHRRNECNDETDGRTALQLTTSAAKPELSVRLAVESDVLLNRLVQALTVGNVQTSQVIRLAEKHVALSVQALEALSVIWEPHGGVGRGSVAQEDTLDLVGVGVCELGVVLHDVAVRSVGDKHKLSLRESLEDLGEEVHADRKGGFHVGEVERASVEGAAGVGLVNEVHVIAGGLFGGGGQIVEVRAVR